MKLTALWVGLVLLSLGGCALNPPYVEMSYAEMSIEAATEAEADRYAPMLFQRAKDAYALAKHAMEERIYSKARKHAKEASRLAEKAEEEAALQERL